MAKLKVIWSRFAANQLDGLFQFLSIESNNKIAKSQIIEILDSTQNLSEFPLSGSIEPLLLNKTREYRYLVKRHIKIIYYINNQTNEVRILDLFDTRQNPTKIVRAID